MVVQGSCLAKYLDRDLTRSWSQRSTDYSDLEGDLVWSVGAAHPSGEVVLEEARHSPFHWLGTKDNHPRFGITLTVPQDKKLNSQGPELMASFA
jgi:hypothetical protein